MLNMTYLCRTYLLPLLLFGAALPMSVRVAKADITQEYNFSGTLANTLNGSTSYSGQFTIDFTTSQITAFDFTASPSNTTSFGTITATDWSGGVGEFTTTSSPTKTFTGVYFQGLIPSNGETMFVLLFGSPLSAFDPSTFTTGPKMTLQGPPGISGVDWDSGFNAESIRGTNDAFSSGTVTPVTSAVPEPGSLLLLATCAALCCQIARRRLLHR